jgi:hypothetical protein
VAPRGRSAAAALSLAALVACDPGKELEEEFDALARDHDVAVVADQRILVGGYGYGGVRDACTPLENEECEDDALAIIATMNSGSVTVASASGTQFNYRATTTPGGGVVTLTVQHEEHAEDTDGTPDPPITVDVPIDVLPPEGAVVSPYCTPGVRRVEPPYLVPTGGQALVSWSFLLDGRVEPGDDGSVPVEAPALELLEASAPLAFFRAPDAPTLATVSSTTYDSSFDFEVHDPGAAVLMMEVRGLNFVGDAIEIAAWSDVDGRPVCSEQAPRTFTSETPAVCLVRYAGETFESHEVTAGWADVVPIAAGDCRVRATVPDTALDAALQFAVAPLQPDDMWWQNTCESAAITCGLSCAFDVVQENGCEWTWTDEYSCGDEPEEITCHYLQRYVGLECPDTAELPPVRVECWEDP